MSEAHSQSRSGFPVWAILLIIGALVVTPVAVVILGCFGVFFLGARTAAIIPPMAPAASATDLPLEAPFAADYPEFKGDLEKLAPVQVGRFRRTESSRALDLDDATATWIAFYTDGMNHEIHLRLRQYTESSAAYRGIKADAAAAITTRVVRLEAYERKEKPAGTYVLGHYHNDFKNVEADVIWMTIGNVAIVIASKDGQFAEDFLSEYETAIAY